MANAASDASQPWPPAPYAWYVVAILLIANIISLIDRQILALLVEPLRADLGLTDTGISLLHGFAFALFYSTMALPLARLADRRSRRSIIAIGIAVWSVMTALCGFARTFWTLFLARMGVGVGEATLMPSAYSLLADYFPPNKLALPTGLFVAGIPAGVGLSLIAGAAIIEAVEAFGPVTIAGVGTLATWQIVFVIIGLLGLPVVLLMLSVREPVRRRAAGERAVTESGYSITEVLVFFRANRTTYATLFGAYVLFVASASGINAWAPTFFIRSYGMTASEAGRMIGTVALIVGPLGALFGGWLADHLQSRGVAQAKLKVFLLAGLCLPVPGIVGPLMPSAEAATVCLGFIFFFGSATAAPTISAVQEMTPNRMRAQTTAVLYFFVNLIGVGVGPLTVALITDYVFRNPAALRYSISLFAGIVGVMAIALIFMCFRPHKESLARAAMSITPGK